MGEGRGCRTLAQLWISCILLCAAGEFNKYIWDFEVNPNVILSPAIVSTYQRPSKQLQLHTDKLISHRHRKHAAQKSRGTESRLYDYHVFFSLILLFHQLWLAGNVFIYKCASTCRRRFQLTTLRALHSTFVLDHRYLACVRHRMSVPESGELCFPGTSPTAPSPTPQGTPNEAPYTTWFHFCVAGCAKVPQLPRL